MVLPAGTKIGDAEIDTIEKSGIFADEGYAIVYVKFQEHAERMIVTKDIEASVRTITPADVIASFGYLLNVIDGMEGKDDIDHLATVVSAALANSCRTSSALDCPVWNVSSVNA